MRIASEFQPGNQSPRRLRCTMKNQPTGPKESAMPALLREVLGDVLRQARINQGRTLRQVSDDARVSLGYLSEVERGRKEASSELLSAICDALDVPLSQLLTNASEQLVGRRPAQEPATSSSPRASNIDASTKVVIPPVVSLALSASA